MLNNTLSPGDATGSTAGDCQEPHSSIQSQFFGSQIDLNLNRLDIISVCLGIDPVTRIDDRNTQVIHYITSDIS